MTARPHLLVCQRVADMVPDELLPGSVVRPCATCDSPVFVSMSGQRETRERATPIVCLHCVLILVRTSGPMGAATVPGGLEEALAHVARGNGGRGSA